MELNNISLLSVIELCPGYQKFSFVTDYLSIFNILNLNGIY